MGSVLGGRGTFKNLSILEFSQGQVANLTQRMVSPGRGSDANSGTYIGDILLNRGLDLSIGGGAGP